MLKKVENDAEILFILNNLRKEDEQELIALYGDNWKEETLANLKNKDFYVLYGKCNNSDIKPIAMGDFCRLFPQDNSIACVWLLTTKFIYKNKSLFWKNLIRMFKQNCLKYDIMYNFIYKSNVQAKKWLKKIGFKFDNPHPDGINLKEGFEFFYKTKERK